MYNTVGILVRKENSLRHNSLSSASSSVRSLLDHTPTYSIHSLFSRLLLSPHALSNPLQYYFWNSVISHLLQRLESSESLRNRCHREEFVYQLPCSGNPGLESQEQLGKLDMLETRHLKTGCMILPPIYGQVEVR